MSRRLPSMLLTTMTLATLAGCSPIVEASSDSSPWAAEFEAALEKSTTSFERDVLADGEITFDEYREAGERWASCMRDKGYSAQAELNELDLFQYETVTPAGSDLEREPLDNGACERGTTLIIASLYASIQSNPRNTDASELYASCLVRRGLVDEPFTGQDFAEAMTRSEIDDAFPFDMDDPAFAACVSRPEE